MALLLLVPMQLKLPGMGLARFDSASSFLSEDLERDLRNGRQWLASIQSYCKFRAGLAWRRASDRFNPNRLWYMNGLRCVQDVLYAPVESLQLVLPTLDRVDCLTGFERELAAMDRSILVTRLMAASSFFTDRRLLSHLPKMKLARMLARAEESAQTERRRA